MPFSWNWFSAAMHLSSLMCNKYILMSRVYRRVESPIHCMLATKQRHTLELLVAAGLSYSMHDTAVAHPSAESHSIMLWMNSLLTIPKSLKDLSRLVVRRSLTGHAQGKTLIPLVELLELPATVFQYLLLDVDQCIFPDLR